MEGETTPQPTMPVNTDSATETGENWRNPDGTLKPGHPPMGGRPKGFSITALIRQKLDEVPLGQMKSYGEQVVETIMSNAIVNKDQRALKDIWEYMDGKPSQPVEVDVNKESLATITDFLKAVGTKHDDKPTETEA